MLHCVPARAVPGHAVCAQLDLLELWRFVQRIHAGESGYALVFDEDGKLLASGSGRARAAILTGERISSAAHRGSSQYLGAEGVEVIAGWATLPGLRWSVAVEQPVREALGAARTAQWILAAVLVFALGLSVLVGLRQSARVLEVLATEERWKTAGRLASSITHDLGHRLRTLQLTSELASDGNPAFLPRIRENLASEVAALRKFVADFSDLGRDAQPRDRRPLEVGAFLESVAHTAAAHGQTAGVAVEVLKPPAPLWVNADHYLLERALLNLTSNAIEASPRNSAVQLGAAAQAGGVALWVKDQGHGIEPERLENLFDAFVSTRRTGSHLGMGLANVKRICDAHQATVAVQSSPQGSTFTIALGSAPAPQSSSALSEETSP
jgi:signal transduction histidine kinase